MPEIVGRNEEAPMALILLPSGRLLQVTTTLPDERENSARGYIGRLFNRWMCSGPRTEFLAREVEMLFERCIKTAVHASLERVREGSNVVGGGSKMA